MNVARHHNEWLSLLDISGPFVSLPVLLRVFPQGLDRRDASQAARLRESYEDWIESGNKLPAVHHAWIRHVLSSVLAYPANLLAEGQAIPPGLEAVLPAVHETLRPDMVLKRTEGDQKPILLISTYAASQDLQKPVNGKLWKANPGTRMMELLHAADVPIGLVTNGEEWMLVSARRGDTTGFASWFADLWMQEPLTLRAFHSLLHLRRLIGVAESDTLPSLVVESSKDQQEVTDQLGYQVRDAVEVLVQAFDRIDAESGRKLLAAVDEKTLYDGALTVMMRLVFLFSAEERGLLLLGDPLYDQNYAVSTLSELLRERADQHGEEVLERRHDAWCRLLATFRAVHGGVEHEAMRLPPYGGTLFDPDRYPFLEGRPIDGAWQSSAAKPLVINNRVVLHLLEALQVLRVRVPGGGPAEARRLSFSALDIEQIGHVYEGLLDHTAKRADEPILGLVGSKDKDSEISLRHLEELAQKGVASLVEFLREQTGRSENALRQLIEDNSALVDEHRLLMACGQDEHLAQRVKRFASLLRADRFGRVVVVGIGSIYVTVGSDRRNTGTHYTPRSMTEPIVRNTLEPLAYVGPAEGLPSAEWVLRGAKEILALKVCDMAMGSGAFLVESCRYLSERLVESWDNSEREYPGSFVVTPDGELSTGSPKERLIPRDSAERVALARRYVADRCLYGVDINPMAVEMAKLSLWLITLQRDRPFTFLDHALKCGDSLLGITSIGQLQNFSLRPDAHQITFATSNLIRSVEDAAAKRRALEDLPSNHNAEIEVKNRLHSEAEAATATMKSLADAVIGFELRGLDGKRYEEQRTIAAHQAELEMRKPTTFFESYAREQLGGRSAFHWLLEFPEVMAFGGFDAFVGNPPFLGGLKLETTFGTNWRGYVVEHLAGGVRGVRGTADLSVYFLLRAAQLISTDGGIGVLATNTISEGDSRAVGLDRLVERQFAVYRAIKSCKWPGTASLEVAQIWLGRRPWNGKFLLDGQEVPGITSQLTAQGATIGRPLPLESNVSKAFQGSIVLGKGLVLTLDEGLRLRQDIKNRDVVLPYLTGDDLNSRSDQSPSRWVINFRDWPLTRKTAPADYEGPTAEDYPDCLAIVEERVRPERLSYDPSNNWNKKIRTYWWHFGQYRWALEAAMEGTDRVLVACRVTKYVTHHVVSRGPVFDVGLNVLIDREGVLLPVLESNVYEAWVRSHASSLETRLRYILSDCFETFPFLNGQLVDRDVQAIGREFHDVRRSIMRERNEGVTETYNRFHDSTDHSEDVVALRTLQRSLDKAVAIAYGWTDLDLEHDFHTTKGGVRLTISERARQNILDRLLALNQQLHGTEALTGLHEKGKKKRRTRRNAGAAPQGSLPI